MIENPFEGGNERPSEFKLHLAIKKHYESCFIGPQNPNLKIFHIANESRDAAQGYWNKVLGIEAGASDLIAGWPVSNVGVCEIKLIGGKLTNNQNRFLSWAKLVGWKTGVVRSVLQFHNLGIAWGWKAEHHKIQEPDYRSDRQKKSDAFDFFSPK